MRRTLYGPDHEAFRESAREFVNRNILPVAEKLIDQRFIDREIWLEAGRNGFLGLEVPEAYGGSEAGDYRFNAVLAEELARQCSCCLELRYPRRRRSSLPRSAHHRRAEAALAAQVLHR
ncbi:hypothetical protein GCM10020255_029180 [Rhodococcus baikonurensis]